MRGRNINRSSDVNVVDDNVDCFRISKQSDISSVSKGEGLLAMHSDTIISNKVLKGEQVFNGITDISTKQWTLEFNRIPSASR